MRCIIFLIKSLKILLHTAFAIFSIGLRVTGIILVCMNYFHDVACNGGWNVYAFTFTYSRWSARGGRDHGYWKRKRDLIKTGQGLSWC